jgi:acyl carrier protein
MTTTATAAITDIDRAEIEEKVRLLVAEAVGRPAAAVTLNASLIGELGADSLSLLDLVFMLERAFAIQITRGEIEQTARGDMTDDEFAPGGVISEAGLGRLRALMPEAAARITPGLRPSQILTLFSARTFASIVIAKLARGADPASAPTS